MILTHHSRRPQGPLQRFSRPPCDTDHKPGGLWLSEEGYEGWLELTTEQVANGSPGWDIADVQYETKFELIPSEIDRVLTIRTEPELSSFVQRYGESTQRNCSTIDLNLYDISSLCDPNCSGQCFNCYGFHIIWGRVQSEYKGIAVAPFHEKRSYTCGDPLFHWYRFDCASWCIWDTSCLLTVA